MQVKVARRAAALFNEADQLRKIANRLEAEASRLIEGGAPIHYDMAEDAKDGKLSVIDSAISPREPEEVDAYAKKDRSAISEDPDSDFSGLIESGNHFRPLKKKEITTSSVRRQVRR